MKNYKIFSVLAAGLLLTGMTACENSDIEFPDFEGGTTAYFAYQSPVRVLNMGSEADYDTSLDREHKCYIYSTFGGSTKGSKGIVNVAIDNSLCNNLYFDADATNPVKAMPQEYYKLATTSFDYAGGMMGGTEVQFTDAFFNDPISVQGGYVIPLVMTGQTGFDHILTGEKASANADDVRTNPENWSVQPKDYVLYCVKYQCKYAAWWLRKGEDKVTINGVTTTISRTPSTIEKAEQKQTLTVSLQSASMPVSYTVEDKVLNAEIVMNFDGSDNCTITAPAGADYTVSGNGSFGDKSEKLAWGNKDRDGLHLQYTITWSDGSSATTKDDMVWMRSGVAIEQLSLTYKK